MNQPLIWQLDRIEIVSALEKLGEPPYRADQIWQGLYKDLVHKLGDISTLPKTLTRKLEQEWEFSALEVVTSIHSKNKSTTKTLFKLWDGHLIEAVLMSYDNRQTLCISTQAGCAMGCVFCATGQMGYRRNLTSGEIVEQVIYYARELAKSSLKVSNVVLMGMGEPFHNYDETMAAIDRLNDEKGFGLGARRFTISTVGLVPAIRRFADEHRQVNLAISLHAADDALRLSMLPINQRYPIADLMDACRYYVATTNRRITFEWALIQDKNDSPEQAHQLGKLLAGLLAHVNIIPLNPTKGFDGDKSTPERVESFRKIVAGYGISCTVRVRRGIEIQAGCGQLAVTQD